MNNNNTLPSKFGLFAFIAGVGALVAMAVLAYFVSGFDVFFQSYLFGWLFWLGLTLGCLIFMYVGHMAGGSWGALVRRPLEAGGMVMPLMALLFVPVALGMGSLFEWVHPEFIEAHPIVAAKTAYLNIPFFLARAAIYFVVWSFGAWFFFKRAKDQDENEQDSERIGFNLKSAGALWILIHVLTVTLAMVDWSMSLTPEFFSGIYPVIYMIGQAITAVCFVILLTVYVASKNAQVDSLLNSKRLQDLGNFLMAFTMFWAYTSFAQLIILWSNNIVETNPYYVLRFSPAWRGVGLFLILFGFFAPFVILFSRWVKRKRQALVLVALWALLVRLTDLFYIVIPNFEREGLSLSILDLASVVAIGGLWLGAFAYFYNSRSPLPVHDPRLAAADHHGHEEEPHKAQFSGAGD